MNLKNKFLSSSIGCFLWLFREHLKEVVSEMKYSYDNGKFKNWHKLETDLTIRIHALEKGMSIGRVRNGFGQKKAKAILADLKEYKILGGDKQFIIKSCSVIDKYIQFNHFDSENDVVKLYNRFCKEFNISRIDYGGIVQVRHQSSLGKDSTEFEKLIKTRFAVRDFSGKPLNKESVERALSLCEKSPSACNRQSWRIYVIYNKEKLDKLFLLQGGSRGFSEDMQGAILICADKYSYAMSEGSLPFIDCGLYAMNLMYALQVEDVANIPLTMSRPLSVLQKIRHLLEIPDNEIPTLLIGIGSFKEEYKAAASDRKCYNQYVKTIS